MRGAARKPNIQRPAAEATAKERLMDGALRLFARRGYAATSVREIVAEAGVTKPVLYYYFGSKEGIYSEILITAWEDFKALMDGIERAERKGGNGLVRLCLSVYDWFEMNMDLVRLAYSIYYGPPQGAPPFDFGAFHRLFHGAILRLVRAGIRSKALKCREPEAMALAVLGAWNGIAQMALAAPETGKKAGKKDLEKILRIIMAGMKTG
jgi:AcrR family transcriptional regulator